MTPEAIAALARRIHPACVFSTTSHLVIGVFYHEEFMRIAVGSNSYQMQGVALRAPLVIPKGKERYLKTVLNRILSFAPSDPDEVLEGIVNEAGRSVSGGTAIKAGELLHIRANEHYMMWHVCSDGRLRYRCEDQESEQDFPSIYRPSWAVPEAAAFTVHSLQ